MSRPPYQNFWGNNVIGEGTKLGAFVEIGEGVRIGKRCKVEAFAFLCPGIIIGDDVFIGPHVCFTNDKNPNLSDERWRPLNTYIGDKAVIGANATILPGINIGKRAVIGAGAVVTKDVPDGVTVVGNPAKTIKR